MPEYSRKVLSELTKLKKKAFERAQNVELEILYKEFDRWKKKRLSSDSLELAIDKHKGFRKEILENQYQIDGDPGVPVADAINRGYLTKKDLSAEAYKSIENLIDLVNI